ncbi:discoidin domain-containing protein [Sinomicrobium kalidii]|uniref:discoidin domain-containing protein n=1 Tax=Sinomicrobium kalidii TaxID=2900738 RepID=UPI001E59CCDC|nr:discoidin domain-containing protein [Sinomicrobium kalidii]UGU17659.1 discoidin domain-containing protein [Sinomicrobium kalidii]
MKTIKMNVIKKVSGLLMAFCISANFVSCSSDLVEEETVMEKPDEEPDDNTYPDEVFTANRPDQEPLNVVYFIPTDFVNVYESKESTIQSNLSEAMLFAQEWYKKQMELGGYPDKTFALFTRNSNTDVRVIPVYGNKASDEYANNNEVRTEVRTYLESIPDEAGGAHTLILCDDGTGFQNNANGRMAVARSPDDFTMVNTGKTIDGLQLLTSVKYGTLLHELGHALNAPHVAHQASESPYLSIMGGGGANRWDTGGREDEVKFLASSLAIFDVCAVFNKTDNGIDYYAEEPDVKMVSYAVEKDNSIQATKATFTFTSDIPAKYLYVGMDAEPTATNSDYDKVAFTTTAMPTGNTNEYKAELEMPYSEFFNGFDRDGIKTDNNIEFSVNILTENGFREIPLTYNFTISSANSPEPDNNINKETVVLSDRSTWSITANTTTHGQPIAQGAETMLDGDFSTFWFSDWPTQSASDTPHIINVDMGEENTFNGIYMHSLRTPNPQFRPKHVLVELSSDNIVFTTAADYTEPINNTDVKVLFDNEQTARYIRITVDEVYTGNGVENLTINELDIIVD